VIGAGKLTRDRRGGGWNWMLIRNRKEEDLVLVIGRLINWMGGRILRISVVLLFL
jgi:hypothetical protein